MSRIGLAARPGIAVLPTCSILELAAQLLRVQLIDDGQERRERLPAPGGGGDQDVLSGMDDRDRVGLGLGQALELGLEPLPDEGLHEAEDLFLRSCGAHFV